MGLFSRGYVTKRALRANMSCPLNLRRELAHIFYRMLSMFRLPTWLAPTNGSNSLTEPAYTLKFTDQFASEGGDDDLRHQHSVQSPVGQHHLDGQHDTEPGAQQAGPDGLKRGLPRLDGQRHSTRPVLPSRSALVHSNTGFFCSACLRCSFIPISKTFLQ